MPDLMFLIKAPSLYMAPFVNSVIVYFALVRDPQGELWTTLLKCMPIVLLMLFVVLKGYEFTKEYRYSHYILVGLVFSCAADALLNIDMFPHGMGTFALAQIAYILAFGWKPLNVFIAIPLFLAAGGMVAMVFKNLDEVLVIGFPVYSVLLATMCWRSLARAIHHRDAYSVLCGIGSLAFLLSDSLIGIDMFLVKIPHARIWIMITYYLAQFAIALSTYSKINLPKQSND